MDEKDTINALSALAQPTRLQAFRLLVRHEPEGLPAGELAQLLGVPQNTLSNHLSILSRAGLVTGERYSRSIVYRAALDGFRKSMRYLMQDCCGGNPDLCASLVEDLTPCCPAPTAVNLHRSN